MKSRFNTEEEMKVAQAEAALDGNELIHHPFCNFQDFRKVKDCPSCKNLYLTKYSTTEEIFWIPNEEFGHGST